MVALMTLPANLASSIGTAVGLGCTHPPTGIGRPSCCGAQVLNRPPFGPTELLTVVSKTHTIMLRHAVEEQEGPC